MNTFGSVGQRTKVVAAPAPRMSVPEPAMPPPVGSRPAIPMPTPPGHGNPGRTMPAPGGARPAPARPLPSQKPVIGRTAPAVPVPQHQIPNRAGQLWPVPVKGVVNGLIKRG